MLARASTTGSAALSKLVNISVMFPWLPVITFSICFTTSRVYLDTSSVTPINAYVNAEIRPAPIFVAGSLVIVS